MPPEDNTPDFDSMTPEQIMAWMETLAIRQGATEGIISDESSRPQVQEIDPTTVDIKDNYIPYGMSAEQWEKKQAEENAKKEAKKASAPTPQPVSAPPPPAPTPAPTPVATQPAADATPDFDSMTPEQIMAWMETLAVRQGATEGIISNESDRPQVQEIDPTSVDIKDNYIPYGMTAEQWEKKQAEENAKKAAQKSSKPQGKTPFTPPSQTDLPVLEDSPTQPAPVFEAIPATDDWLSGLASGTNNELPNEFPEFDLSGLGDSLQDLDLDLPNFELEGFGDLAGLAEGNTDPVNWLDNLVNEGNNTGNTTAVTDNPFDSIFDDKPVTTPDTGNTIEWLESLAKRQGVSDEELITRPEMDLPELALDPNFVSPENDPFNFDSVDNLDQAALDATDPVAWLDSLATSQNTKVPPQSFVSPKDVTNDDMLQKLNKGISDPDDMKGWMDKLLEEGSKRQVPDYINEDEEEPIQANIPDWLVEQVGLPPEMGGTTSAPVEIDFDALIAPEPTSDMPDWLLEASPLQEEAEAVAGDMPDWLTDTLSDESDKVQSLFQPASSPLSTEEIEVDMSDPWVEAFELERQVAMGNISDEEVIFSNEPISMDAVLDDMFEDEPLPMGELESVPSWMDTSAPVTPVEVAQPISDLPDWLRETEDEAPVIMADEPLPDWLNEAGIENTEDVPDWLLETVGEEQAPVPVFTPPAPTPVPVVVKPQSPAPVPTGNINASQVLQQARAKIQSGDLEGGLGAYEAVIRANTALDMVVSDLSEMVKQEGNKTNASIYRVLGDGLMRQGRLQQALDTYRRALNLL
ncbi:MAG: tetratricopeptide repeat protein [bacterium]|nr:tetratricopeptide repeat protein [bacterium]